MYDCDFDVFVILSTFLNFLYEPFAIFSTKKKDTVEQKSNGKMSSYLDFLYEPFAIFFYKKKDTVEQKSNGKMFDALEDNIVNNAH